MIKTKNQKTLTGRHVLLMVIAFFGVIIAVNTVFIYFAVDSFRGEDVKGSYRQGLDYNQRIEARSNEQTLGWTVKSNIVEGDKTELVFSIADARSQQLLGLGLTGTLRHPTDRKRDITLNFAQSPNGTYRSDINADPANWRFMGQAQRGEDTFLFESDVIIQK